MNSIGELVLIIKNFQRLYIAIYLKNYSIAFSATAGAIILRENVKLQNGMNYDSKLSLLVKWDQIKGVDVSA